MEICSCSSAMLKTYTQYARSLKDTAGNSLFNGRITSERRLENVLIPFEWCVATTAEVQN